MAEKSVWNEEVEVLKSIFGSELKICDNSISLTIKPATANLTSEQNVSLYLTLTVDVGTYPTSVARFDFETVRGFNDAKEEELKIELKDLLQGLVGHQMLYEAIQYTTDFLTRYNRPSVECAICLDRLADDAAFHRTECFHYFHPWCLLDFVKSQDQPGGDDNNNVVDDNQNEQIKISVCPNCRAAINIDMERLSSFQRPLESSTELEKLSEDIRKLQNRIETLPLESTNNESNESKDVVESHHVVSKHSSLDNSGGRIDLKYHDGRWRPRQNSDGNAESFNRGRGRGRGYRGKQRTQSGSGEWSRSNYGRNHSGQYYSRSFDSYEFYSGGFYPNHQRAYSARNSRGRKRGGNKKPPQKSNSNEEKPLRSEVVSNTPPRVFNESHLPTHSPVFAPGNHSNEVFNYYVPPPPGFSERVQ